MVSFAYHHRSDAIGRQALSNCGRILSRSLNLTLIHRRQFNLNTLDLDLIPILDYLPPMAAIPNITQATRQYETWLANHLRVLKSDLSQKHRMMAQDPFSFLRATFYRWMQLFPELCPKAREAPVVLAVGDLHVANFGTWRDTEGRLIWGINDFDEAFPLPYTLDLIRLATSASIAIKIGHLSCSSVGACKAILDGYSEALKNGGRPFVIAEDHMELRQMALSSFANPADFWKKLGEERKSKEDSKNAGASKQFIGILNRSLPVGCEKSRILPRVAGVGSLGRPRFVAIAELKGGLVAREAKALVPSACVWAEGIKQIDESLYYMIVRRAVRMPDPFLDISKRFS